MPDAERSGERREAERPAATSEPTEQQPTEQQPAGRAAPAPEPSVPSAPARDRFGWDDLLPDRTSDERDAGWSEKRPDDASDLRRFLDEKPPHHL
jgi:hypothetical protein